MPTPRSLLIAVPLALAILPLACEDAGVADSSQARSQLAAARTAYLQVIANRPAATLSAGEFAASPADDEEARQLEAFARMRAETDRALGAIANQLAPLAGSGHAAAGLMLAEVRLDQANLRMQDLLAETRTLAEARRGALALARAAADLEAAAAANHAVQLPDLASLRGTAGEARRAAGSEQALIETDRRSSARLAESIETFRRRADELNANAIELQRQASAENPIDAFDLIEESAELRRMANEMVVQAAGQEIVLEQQDARILDRDRDRLGLEAKASGGENAARFVSQIRDALEAQSKTFREAASGIRGRLVTAAAAIELGAE